MTEAELIEMLKEAVKDKPVDWVLEDVEDEHNYYFRFILKENDLVLPDEMEAEKNRKIILEMSDKIDLIERNVLDLQGQLQEAYKRNAELIKQNAEAMLIIGQQTKKIKQIKDNECFCGLAEEPVLATEDY